MKEKIKKLASLVVLISFVFVNNHLLAEASSDASVATEASLPSDPEKTIESILKMLDATDEKSIKAFIDSQQMAPGLKDTLIHLRQEFSGIRESLGVDFTEEGAVLTFGSGDLVKSLLVEFDGDRVKSLKKYTMPENDGLSREQAINSHISAIENSWQKSLPDFAKKFSENNLSYEFLDSKSKYERTMLFKTIRRAAEQARGVLVKEAKDETILELDGEEKYSVHFKVEEKPPYRVTEIKANKQIGQLGLTITTENIAEKMSQLEKEHGFSGVVFLQINGSKILHSAYGLKNNKRKSKNTKDTIFGIGSRPIDFTIASIFLLEQKGLLKTDDKVEKFFSVPGDTKEITVKHLLTGRSGLPDYHHNAEDEDPDLTWIDRSEALARIFSQKLLFSPGTEYAHSHSAFVLLAAIIEHVSGVGYFQFIKTEFLDPAGMTRTGEYGDFGAFSPKDFAVGGGPVEVGELNMPPNWGETSWLIKGSGGMYSTIEDLVRFYDFVRGSGKLDLPYAEKFFGPNINIDGSDRGFELFSAYDESGSDQIFVVSNMAVPNPLLAELRDELIKLIERE